MNSFAQFKKIINLEYMLNNTSYDNSLLYRELKKLILIQPINDKMPTVKSYARYLKWQQENLLIQRHAYLKKEQTNHFGES